MQSRSRRLVFTIISLTLIFSLLFLAGEIAIRIFHGIYRDYGFFDPPARLSEIVIDAELGWRASENFMSERTYEDFGGTEYVANLSQNEYGFRLFGDVNSGKPKVLVIGDSFTHAVVVSDDKIYAAALKGLGLEVFAYGAGGYGTLQEYLVFDKYFDLIQPDMIVWQFCTNDFINNLYELELSSRWNNNGILRPYWEDGQIQYRLPRKYGERIRELALGYSRLLYFIVSRVDMLLASEVETVERDIRSKGLEHPGFAKSVQVTDELMGKVRERTGNRPIVAFVANTAVHEEAAFKAISDKHQILLVENVEAELKRARDGGLVVDAYDGNHWNEAGHRIVGETLAKAITAKCLLGLCDPGETSNRSAMK